VRNTGALIGIGLLLVLTGCGSKYVTPGGGVSLEGISDYSIKERFRTKPAAPFPAILAVVRVQEAGYTSYSNRGYGEGNFSVVTTRDIETDEHFDKLASMPQVKDLARVNRLLLPSHLRDAKDLRRAAASLHADMLFLYTLDTSFRIQGQGGPLSVITLGLAPDRRAIVTTTASAALYDVRTGYVYGVAEATHTTDHLANTWSEVRVVDDARQETEREAFVRLLDEFSKTWSAVVEQYATEDRSL